MKLSFSFFSFASVWRSVHGQEQESTYLHGSGSDAEATASKKYGRALKQHLQSLFEEVEEDIINSIVRGVCPLIRKSTSSLSG